MKSLHNASRTSGRRLYREIWKTVADSFFDDDRLQQADWASKENLFDTRIVDDESALACAAEALASLNDKYTHLMPAVEYRQHVAERDETEESAVYSRILQGNIGYMRIETFFRSDIFEQVTAEVEKLKDCDALIIDLRDNGGGLLDATGHCCEYFVKSGTLAGFVRRTPEGLFEKAFGCNNEASISIVEVAGVQREPVLYMRRPALLADKPTVVLINGGTGSSAEVFASAVVENGRENGRCIAIGMETAGKGIAQTTVDIFEGKARLQISVAKFLNAKLEWLGDHAQRVRNGIKPDVEVDDAGDYKAPLSAAYEHLKQTLKSA
jgi:C-terminal processing protease CtpA/Prc